MSLRLSYRKALSANFLSSVAGMAMQAATSPLYLLILSVDQFAQWILVVSIAAYISLVLNGFFYAFMNEITLSSLRKHDEAASDIYNAGFFIIGLLFLVLSLVLVSLIVISGSINGGYGVFISGILINILNISNIMFDANFRSMSRYEFGTNILTILRIFDWVAALIIIFENHEVTTVTFIILLAYKIVMACLMAGYLQAHARAIKLRSSFYMTRKHYAKLFAMAKGQLILSASTAAAVMGPQIIVGTMFSDTISVVFNIYRTYFRLIASMITILSSASWPLLSQMYAEKRILEMQRFLSRMRVQSIGVAVIIGLTMLSFSAPVFEILFGSKVPVDHNYMAIILVSVLLNCGISIQQSLFLATNLISRILVGSFLFTLVGLAVMAFCGMFYDFTSALIVQVAFDVFIFVMMLYATRSIFIILQGQVQAS